MDSLPVELLSRIFINALPPELDDVRHPVHNFSPVQATISCVCQQWNQIAESTPGLWTFIILSNAATSQAQAVMKRRLELSGNLPLNVSMRLLRREPDRGDYYGSWRKVSNDQSFLQMHALLVEQVSRWETLRVEATVALPSMLREWIPPELPNVAGLSLRLEVLG
ncbi:hypothetical protein FRC01_010667, partial [Tulasnella sp. 417]